ncbi:MAG: DUF2267 domain-containing protein [Rhodospirillales bacterium]|nr:DUF2267 domain-containing protein [Rhodospirillales bacterium]
MSATGLKVFDETLQLTNIWLKHVMESLETDDRHRAYLALRATLHALRDRLTPEEALHLGAQLPMLVRGMYYEGWKPSQTPTRERHKADFLGHIAEAFRNEEVDEEAIARAVFALLAEKLTAGEVRKITHALPAELREMWPSGDEGTG